MEGAPLPDGAAARGRERVLPSGTASSPASACTCARSTATACVCTVYEKTTRDVGWDLARMIAGGDVPLPDMVYDGTEGELYDVTADPNQWRNLWNDPGYARRRAELVAELYASLPKPRSAPLPVEAPA